MAKSTVSQLQAQLAELDQMVSERDATIAQLQHEIAVLEAKAGKPAIRQQPDTVKALPDLLPHPPGIRVTCPLNAQHGEVTPNIHRKCPKCFTHCIRMNSEAGKRALVQVLAPATA